MIQVREGDRPFKGMDYRDMVYQIRGTPKVSVRWDGPSHLILRISKIRMEPVFQVIRIGNIRVSYEEDAAIVGLDR